MMHLSNLTDDQLREKIAETFPQPVEDWLYRFEELKCKHDNGYDAFVALCQQRANGNPGMWVGGTITVVDV
jgi:hypothetical protein